MFRRPIQSLTVVCGVVTAMLAMPAASHAGRILDCLFGTAPPSQTTYAPPFAPACVAPACAPAVRRLCACVRPACGSCALCSSCAPQSCQYMPTVVYRALYQPAAVARRAARARGGCGSCYAPYAASYAPYTAAYAVTTYRPFLGTYQTRLVPYTTYRPLYTPVVSYGYVGYSPCTSCSPCGGCSSCGGCSPYVGCSSCGSRRLQFLRQAAAAGR